MTQSGPSRLERFGFLALAGVALVVLAFELSHDFTLWFLASGVVGIPVLVAAAFSLVDRALLYLGGALAAAFGAPTTFQDGHYVIGACLVVGVLANLHLGVRRWRSRPAE